MTLAFADVACRRGGRMLFEGLSFALAAGEAAVVTGPNGVGKSSLVRIAAGLLAPAAGSVKATGACALLTEAAALDGDRTLAAALGFWARLDGVAMAEERLRSALVALDLADLAAVPVRLLSTGQRRRAAIARVAASGAAIWLLDEPANGLDTGSVARLESLVAAHRATGGIVIVATHQPLAIHGGRDIAL